MLQNLRLIHRDQIEMIYMSIEGDLLVDRISSQKPTAVTRDYGVYIPRFKMHINAKKGSLLLAALIVDILDVLNNYLVGFVLLNKRVKNRERNDVIVERSNNQPWQRGNRGSRWSIGLLSIDAMK